jgi:uncharacterized MAPEG superfamily protein
MLGPIQALVLFALWAILLVLLIGASRVAQVLSGKRKPTDFPAGTPHGSDMYWRINRAHLNTLENLPIFAAVVLSALAVGVKDPLFAQLATVVIGARVLQSLIHIASGSVMAVNLRFAAYAAQLVCMVWMGVMVLRATQLI